MGKVTLATAANSIGYRGNYTQYRLGAMADVAKMAAFFGYDDESYVTGQNIRV